MVAVIDRAPYRAAWLLAVVAVCGCRTRSAPGLNAQYDSATQALWRGELADALARADRGVTLSDSAHDSDSAERFRLLRAEVLIARLEPDAASPLLTAPVAPGPQADLFRARQRYLLAKIAVARGRLRDALPVLDEVSAVHDRALHEDAEILGGQVRLRLGRWAEADSRLNAVVSEAAAHDDHYRQALALNNLGMGRLVRSRWDDALPWFTRVLAMTDLRTFTVYAAALNNAGICYSRLGEFDRAIQTQRQAADLHRQGPRVAYEEALGELGNTYVLGDEARQGIPFLRQALDVASSARLWSDAALWAGSLAEALADLGEWDDAAHYNSEARRLKTLAGTRNLVYNTINDGRIAAGRGNFAEAARFFEEAIAAAPTEPGARWEADAGLARVALAEHDRVRAMKHFDAALGTIERTQSDLLHPEYKLSFLTRLIGFYQAYVDALVEQGDVARALEVADSSRARVLAERQSASVQPRVHVPALRQLASRWRSAFLFYWLGSENSYLWVVTPGGVHCERLPPASVVERLVREYQQLIVGSAVDPLATPETAGDRLYQTVIVPALKWVPRNASLVVVPDGALYRVNLETLPVNGGGRRHYLIEDVEIRLAPSLSVLRDSATPASARDRVLLIGNPAPVDPGYPALAYAPVELSSIAALFPADRVVALDGTRATVEAYREADPGRFGILHFAAHAEANVASPLDSAVILAGDRDHYKLYARDVAEERLDADLVTISACRSAGERSYAGEGLVGFAWAFLRAGAERVVAGLWDVDDRSTARLMAGMYAGIVRGEQPARALREAKLALIAGGGVAGRPFYWGPFEVFSRSR